MLYILLSLGSRLIFKTKADSITDDQLYELLRDFEYAEIIQKGCKKGSPIILAAAKTSPDDPIKLAKNFYKRLCTNKMKSRWEKFVTPQVNTQKRNSTRLPMKKFWELVDTKNLKKNSVLSRQVIAKTVLELKHCDVKVNSEYASKVVRNFYATCKEKNCQANFKITTRQISGEISIFIFKKAGTHTRCETKSDCKIVIEKSKISTKFTTFVTAFSIPEKELFVSGKLKQEWTQVFYDYLYPKLKSCMIVIKYKEFYSSQMFHVYGKCRFPNCAKYKIKVEPIDGTDDLSANVMSNGPINEHSHAKYSISRQLRGTRRLDLISKLVGSTGTKVSSSLVLKEDIVRNQFGNIDFIKQTGTLRKIKSQASEFSIFSTDDLRDLIKLQAVSEMMLPISSNKTPKFIRTVSRPLTVLWFCDTQILTLIKNSPTNGYLDSTGSIIRKCNNFFNIYINL